MWWHCDNYPFCLTKAYTTVLHNQPPFNLHQMDPFGLVFIPLDRRHPIPNPKPKLGYQSGSDRELTVSHFFNTKLLHNIMFRLPVSFTQIQISKKDPTGLLSACLKQCLYTKCVLPAVIKERESRASLLVQTCRRVGKDECQSVDTVLVSASMTCRTADAVGHQHPKTPFPCA